MQEQRADEQSAAVASTSVLTLASNQQLDKLYASCLQRCLIGKQDVQSLLARCQRVSDIFAASAALLPTRDVIKAHFKEKELLKREQKKSQKDNKKSKKDKEDKKEKKDKEEKEDKDKKDKKDKGHKKDKKEKEDKDKKDKKDKGHKKDKKDKKDKEDKKDKKDKKDNKDKKDKKDKKDNKDKKKDKQGKKHKKDKKKDKRGKKDKKKEKKEKKKRDKKKKEKEKKQRKKDLKQKLKDKKQQFEDLVNERKQKYEQGKSSWKEQVKQAKGAKKEEKLQRKVDKALESGKDEPFIDRLFEKRLQSIRDALGKSQGSSISRYAPCMMVMDFSAVKGGMQAQCTALQAASAYAMQSERCWVRYANVITECSRHSSLRSCYKLYAGIGQECGELAARGQEQLSKLSFASVEKKEQELA